MQCPHCHRKIEPPFAMQQDPTWIDPTAPGLFELWRQIWNGEHSFMGWLAVIGTLLMIFFVIVALTV